MAKRSQDDLIGQLQALADGLAHKGPPREVIALKTLLLAAREQPITDKQRFVDLVNAILRSTGYRLKLRDGSLCMLCIRPGKTGAGYIQLQKQGGSRGGFATEDFELVPQKHP